MTHAETRDTQKKHKHQEARTTKKHEKPRKHETPRNAKHPEGRHTQKREIPRKTRKPRSTKNQETRNDQNDETPSNTNHQERLNTRKPERTRTTTTVPRAPPDILGQPRRHPGKRQDRPCLNQESPGPLPEPLRSPTPRHPPDRSRMLPGTPRTPLPGLLQNSSRTVGLKSNALTAHVASCFAGLKKKMSNLSLSLLSDTL